MEAGWMLVVLVCAALAYRRVGRDAAHEERVKKLELVLSEWPAAGTVLERLDELEADIEKLNGGDHTMKSVVERANALTKDMLALKQLVAEHREILAGLRTKSALRQASGLDG